MSKFHLIILIILVVGNSCNKTQVSLKEIWNEKDWGTFPQDPTDIISIIYHRFADRRKGLTLSSFEKLVECSTGSTNCPNSSAPQEHPFMYLTDCEINSDLSPTLCATLHSCSKAQDLLSLLPLFNKSTDLISEDDFRILLPAVMYQAQSQLCKDQNIEQATSVQKPTQYEIWGYGILFVTLISACSLAGVSVLPLMARDFYQKLLMVLIGLAVGSLAASSVFHLIPQAYGISGGEDHHHYLLLSLCILFGIWAFFMIERILKVIFIIQKIKSEKIPYSMSAQAIVSPKGKEGAPPAGLEICSSSCGGSVTTCGGDAYSPTGSRHNLSVDCGKEGAPDGGGAKSPSHDVQLIYASQEQAIKASFGHEQKPEKSHESHDIQFRQGKDSVIATVAWMVIFGDGFHNFIDGVSIGAAFQQSILTGISISLAVMCEELPHELGDFAVLLNSGMTMRQALFYNFLSATTCYLGLIIGIVVGEFTQDSTYIFAIAAGMFLYISLVDMLPEMNEVASKAAEKSVGDVIYVLLLQNLGLFLGVFALFFLAYYQDKIMLG